MLKECTLAIIVLNDRQFTKDNLSTVNITRCKSGIASANIFKEISLENFPSFRDFLGKSCAVKHGDVCLITKKIGRPLKISDHPNNKEYDVYEIFIQNGIYQIFQHNLLKIPKN